MQQIKKEYLKTIIASSLILISFVLGYVFAIRYYNLENTNIDNKYIEIVTKKSQIQITSVSQGVDIIVNGKIHSGGTISLQ